MKLNHHYTLKLIFATASLVALTVFVALLFVRSSEFKHQWMKVCAVLENAYWNHDYVPPGGSKEWELIMDCIGVKTPIGRLKSTIEAP
ncbi:MAG: hypothetical protein HYV41_02280 [Candidatus Magasanikbacteria bacterium]|nr:hypothetical protein [Candidatus Magasanikbacteria bacterium]